MALFVQSQTRFHPPWVSHPDPEASPQSVPVFCSVGVKNMDNQTKGISPLRVDPPRRKSIAADEVAVGVIP